MPKCGRCSKEVYDAEEVKAAGAHWHNVCFKCAICKATLTSLTVKDKNSEIYCEPCYGKNFGPKGYGFGGGGGVGLRGADVKEEGTDIGSAGIDSEIQRKLNLKYDEERERNLREWLEALLNEKFEEKTLQEALKSGERLCKAVNLIAPNIVKNINKQKFAAMQRENIGAYIAACRAMAFNKAATFETSDLFEGKNMVLVIENLAELSQRAKRKGNLPVPKEAGGKKGGVDYSSTLYEQPPPASDTTSTSDTQTQTETSTPVQTETSSSEGTKEFCPDCGAAREGGSKNCADCGHAFE